MQILCVSDIHTKHNLINIAPCDVLIIAGDICSIGSLHEINLFVDWIDTQKDNFNRAILIAGNHDWPLMTHKRLCLELFEKKLHDKFIYLEDSEVVIDGIKFYGSPWTPKFHNWAFNKTRGEKLKIVWDNIPDDVDVLITHGPSHGIGDKVFGNPTQSVGCLDLSDRIRKLNNLKLHVFGHIHCSNGVFMSEAIPDVFFCNAAICNEQYQPKNLSYMFEITTHNSHKLLTYREITLESQNGNKKNQ